MALTDNLVAYYSLEEASGTRVDAHGTNDLTEFGAGVGSTTGKVDTCADFDGSVSSLAIQDAGDLDFGADDDWTIANWVKFDVLDGFKIVYSRSNPDAPTAVKDILYRLYYHVTNNVLVGTIGNGTSGAEVSSDVLGAPSTGTWYFVVLRHDKTANQLQMKINDVDQTPASWSGGTQGGGSGTYFRLGDQGAGGFYLNGQIDEFMFWNGRAISDSECTELYNSGNGRDYAYVSGGAAFAGWRPRGLTGGMSVMAGGVV